MDDSLIHKTHTPWPEYLAIAQRSLAFCHEHRLQFIIDPEEPQKLHAAAFFAKLLKDTEAALLLLMNGMFSQARSMLRVAIECEITLAKCCSTPDFAEAYRIASERERLRLLKGIQRVTPGEFDDVKEAIPKTMADELAVKLKGTPEKRVEQWATDVGMGDLYQTGYRLYCIDVHSLTGSTGQYLKYSSGVASEVNWEPEKSDYRSELTEVSRIAINGFVRVANLFGLLPDETFNQLRAEHLRLEDLATTQH